MKLVKTIGNPQLKLEKDLTDRLSQTALLVLGTGSSSENTVTGCKSASHHHEEKVGNLSLLNQYEVDESEIALSTIS